MTKVKITSTRYPGETAELFRLYRRAWFWPFWWVVKVTDDAATAILWARNIWAPRITVIAEK